MIDTLSSVDVVSTSMSDYLNYRETAEHFRVSVSTVRNWARAGILPPRDVLTNHVLTGGFGPSRRGGWYRETLESLAGDSTFQTVLRRAQKMQDALKRAELARVARGAGPQPIPERTRRAYTLSPGVPRRGSSEQH